MQGHLDNCLFRGLPLQEVDRDFLKCCCVNAKDMPCKMRPCNLACGILTEKGPKFVCWHHWIKFAKDEWNLDFCQCLNISLIENEINPKTASLEDVETCGFQNVFKNDGRLCKQNNSHLGLNFIKNYNDKVLAANEEIVDEDYSEDSESENSDEDFDDEEFEESETESDIEFINDEEEDEEDEERDEIEKEDEIEESEEQVEESIEDIEQIEEEKEIENVEKEFTLSREKFSEQIEYEKECEVLLRKTKIKHGICIWKSKREKNKFCNRDSIDGGDLCEIHYVTEKRKGAYSEFAPYVEAIRCLKDPRGYFERNDAVLKKYVEERGKVEERGGVEKSIPVSSSSTSSSTSSSSSSFFPEGKKQKTIHKEVDEEVEVEEDPDYIQVSIENRDQIIRYMDDLKQIVSNSRGPSDSVFWVECLNHKVSSLLGKRKLTDM